MFKELSQSIDFGRKNPICLLDIDQNRKLASINFTSYQANKMPLDEFRRDVLPEFAKALEGVVDVKSLASQS